MGLTNLLWLAVTILVGGLMFFYGHFHGREAQKKEGVRRREEHKANKARSRRQQYGFYILKQLNLFLSEAQPVGAEGGLYIGYSEYERSLVIYINDNRLPPTRAACSLLAANEILRVEVGLDNPRASRPINLITRASEGENEGYREDSKVVVDELIADAKIAIRRYLRDEKSIVV